jgi:uncharacterized Fe-S cluster protein YjdI
VAAKLQTYPGEGFAVTFDPTVCIHAAECVRGLPRVFRPTERPWVRPAESAADEIARVVARCPTGALQFHGAGKGASAVGSVSVTVEPDGPLYVRGAVRIQRPDGTVLREDTRVALCRCGKSGNRPFCDGSHKRQD